MFVRFHTIILYATECKKRDVCAFVIGLRAHCSFTAFEPWNYVDLIRYNIPAESNPVFDILGITGAVIKTRSFEPFIFSARIFLIRQFMSTIVSQLTVAAVITTPTSAINSISMCQH